MTPTLIALIAVAILVIITLVKGAVIVPQKSAFIIERLGKFDRTLEAGFHILIPFVDRAAYVFSLKEQVVDIPAQICITKDNVSVEVDGIIYLEIQDAHKAAYGIDDYLRAATQLAQTTLRSAIGKIDLDKTFEERDKINTEVIDAIDQAAMSWGVKVLRYEIKDITPPVSVKQAMEAQMTAERQKRADIATSEGLRQSMINQSEGEKQKQINEASGKAAQVMLIAEADAKRIEYIATATAEGINKVAATIKEEGGIEALNMRLAEQYITQFGNLAKTNNTIIMPSNVADVAGIIATAMSTVKEVKVS
ncbi:stomatin-like protein [uncultured Desulfobulbus sp.]|uniref:SPFH domain-containing protein n=1 Tax=uncultured Desulfobulbus sp. TaxID=239745 RepID=UPI0029C8168B|nr:stomatin-like protein [uncultured Desulfobulbus sp.]